MNLELDNKLTKWFTWAYDHVLFSGGSRYKRAEDVIRGGGISLCSFVWVIFWAPLINLFLAGLFGGFLILTVFIEPFIKDGIWGILMALAIITGVPLTLIAVVGIPYLAIKGVNSTGAGPVIKYYSKALKDKVCPRITFK